MRFKTLSILASLLCIFQFSSAQEMRGIHFAQGLGIVATTANISGHAIGNKDGLPTDANFQLRLRQFGLVYTIRAELTEWNWGSISVGSPLMAGFSLTQKYRSVDVNSAGTRVIDSVKGGSFAFEVPLICDLNFGLHSAADEHGRIGFFVGAGYGYSYTRINASLGKQNFDGFDPVARVGIRGGRSWERRWGLAFSVRGSQRVNRTYGLQLLKEL